MKKKVKTMTLSKETLKILGRDLDIVRGRFVPAPGDTLSCPANDLSQYMNCNTCYPGTGYC